MPLAHLAALEMSFQNLDFTKSATPTPAAHGNTIQAPQFHALENTLSFLADKVVSRCVVEHIKPRHDLSSIHIFFLHRAERPMSTVPSAVAESFFKASPKLP